MDEPISEGPAVRKRVLVGGPPSDLPSEGLRYPGKPLTHRYTPTEQARKVEEEKTLQGPRLATDLPFKPVASVNYPDRDIHFGPVSNTKQRGLQPIALDRTLTLPTSDVSVFELSQELHPPLEARLEKLTKQPEQGGRETLATGELTRGQEAPKEPSPQAASIQRELEEVKELARQELARRSAEKLQTSVSPQQPSGSALAETTGETTSTKTQLTSPDEETKQLLREAERLEAELIELRKGIAARRESKLAEETADPRLRQIEQLVLEKNELHRKLDLLTAAFDKATTRQQELEAQLSHSQAEKEELAKQLEVEKANSAEQRKAFEEKKAEWQRQQASLAKYGEERDELARRLAETVKERDALKEELAKLERLLEEVKEQPKMAEESREVGKPTKEVEIKLKGPAVRLVKPQVAVGKMAPPLTSAPNVINGVVKDAAGLLLSNVIIVVKDDRGEPVRALKTNKIGQFAISTPLPNGTYTMELEEPSHSFDVIQVEVRGKVMPPVEIRANN